MLNLESLLERFRKSIGRNVLAKESVVFAVESVTGIKLKPEEISIKEFTLEINSSPVKKNEIKLKEEKVLSEIRNQTGQNITKVFYK
jgi:hypothetical protein